MENDYKNNPKIKLGKVDLLDESYEDPKNHKLRITTWIDGDIYDELKKRALAGEADGKYQTLMNDLLREVLFENVEAQASGGPSKMDQATFDQIIEKLQEWKQARQHKRRKKTGLPKPVQLPKTNPLPRYPLDRLMQNKNFKK